ncbi:MAG: hypothetical protein JWN43_1776 [Gammaproteobacteria bacterium]|nr:hypothetical protein [Gammaproteobacteria bacterium]
MNTKPAPIRSVAFTMAALLIATYAPLSLAAKFKQATFASAEEAGHALFLAVQNHDERAVTEILQEGNSPVSADDELQSKLDRERFVQKYEEMHRWARQPHGDRVLYIGAENWPFPIPLVSRNGVWRFDADAGMHEIRYRRIGENEVTAIALCQALVAQSHADTADVTDGLIAAMKSGDRPVAFHGYYFRRLARSGNRFAAIAYPAAYRSSGVMTFIVEPDGGSYEKDLGPNTRKLAGTMTEYRNDGTWRPTKAAP